MLSADDLLRQCRVSARPGAKSFVDSGRWWFWTGRERTLYSHAQVPNGRIPDCVAGGSRTAIGMATARSRHPGGVNALMGDGSIRFTKETIAHARFARHGNAERLRARRLMFTPVSQNRRTHTWLDL